MYNILPIKCGSAFSINKDYFLFKDDFLLEIIWQTAIKVFVESKDKNFFPFKDEKVLIFIFIGSNLADGKASSLPSVSITSTKLCSFGRRENKNIFHSKQIFFF